MKRINKVLPIAVSAILIFAPYYVSAEELQATPTPEPTASAEPVVTPTPTPSATPEATSTPEATPTPTPTPEAKKSVSLDEYKITLDPNKTFKLTATVEPEGAEVVWESSDEEVATVDKNGLVTAGKSKGSATITVKLKDSESTSASCKVEVTASNDATLKSLSIEGYEISPEFKSDVLEYTVNVDKTTTKIEYDYELTNKGATFFGPSESKNKDLKNGSILEFKVVAEDKTSKVYKLTIVKEDISVNLKSLKINGYALNEVFEATKLEYTASIPYEIETITVQANAEDKGAEVKITGVTNLKVGENTVNITVKDELGNSKIYKIIVTREKEVSVEEKPTSIITSSNVVDKNENTTSDNKVESKPSDGTGDDFLKYAIVSIACFILFAIGGIGVYFYIKTSPKKLKKEVIKTKTTTEEKVSPIVEVEKKETKQNHSNISEIMDEKLVETREFKKEDLEETTNKKVKENSDTESLFDDSEDV